MAPKKIFQCGQQSEIGIGVRGGRKGLERHQKIEVTCFRTKPAACGGTEQLQAPHAMAPTKHLKLRAPGFDNWAYRNGIHTERIAENVPACTTIGGGKSCPPPLRKGVGRRPRGF